MFWNVLCDASYGVGAGHIPRVELRDFRYISFLSGQLKGLSTTEPSWNFEPLTRVRSSFLVPVYWNRHRPLVEGNKDKVPQFLLPVCSPLNLPIEAARDLL